MAPQSTPPSPRVLLSRWLAQLHYNSIRNIETVFSHVTRTDSTRVLRGFQIANDLVLTRKRTFYKMAGLKAEPISIEEVSANYNLEALRMSYRNAMESWKNTRRHERDRQKRA